MSAQFAVDSAYRSSYPGRGVRRPSYHVLDIRIATSSTKLDRASGRARPRNAVSDEAPTGWRPWFATAVASSMSFSSFVHAGASRLPTSFFGGRGAAASDY